MNVALFKTPVGWPYTALDVLLFKASWLVLVIYQSEAVIYVLGLIVLRIIIWPAMYRYLAFILTTLVTGIAMDLMLMSGGILEFPENKMPIWLVTLWFSFAMTLPRGFSVFAQLRPELQSIIGMVAGFVGYGMGFLLGAVKFGYSLPVSLGIITFLWMLLVPFLFWIDKTIYKKNEIAQ